MFHKLTETYQLFDHYLVQNQCKTVLKQAKFLSLFFQAQSIRQ